MLFYCISELVLSEEDTFELKCMFLIESNFNSRIHYTYEPVIVLSTLDSEMNEM